MIKSYPRETKCEDSLMSDLKFCPFTPNLSEIINVLEVDFRRFLQNLPRVVEISFSFASSTTFLVELRKVDIEPMEVCSRSSGVDCRQRLSVRFRNLQCHA